jgi:iron complex outermembrane receptor protein
MRRRRFPLRPACRELGVAHVKMRLARVDGIARSMLPLCRSVGTGADLFPNCAPGIYDPRLDPLFGMARCVFDTAAADGVNMIPEQETTSFFASGRWQFHPGWQLHGTAAYTSVDTRQVIQPAPISDQFIYGPNDIPATFLLPPSSPYYPTALAEAADVGGQPLNLRYRAYPLGFRDMTDKNEAWQTVAGIKGTAWNWDFDFDFVYSRNETSSRLNHGFARYSQLLPLLNSGRVNPFGPNTPEVQAEIDAMQFRDETFTGKSIGYLVDGKASGELFKLPVGSVAAAFGYQAGKQELEQTFNPTFASGDIIGLGGIYVPESADRNHWATFAEFSIPIVNSLEFNAAVRYDDYSDFGQTTNPKLSIRWNPVRQLLLRGSWGTGFVVPTLTQAYGANTTGLSPPGLTDPLRCPTTQDTNDCLTQFTVIFGGNANLKPQKSEQWMIGFVLEPVPQVSLSFDWFNLDVRDQFSNGTPLQTILNDQASASPQFDHLVTRGPVQPQFPHIPGPITSIDQRFTNIGRVMIEGFDVNIKADSPPTAIGRFSFNLDGTYYRKYDVQQTDGTFAGAASNQLNSALSGTTPRYKQYATISLTYGPWSATLGNQYQSSYIDVSLDGNGNPRRVGTLSLWDLYFAYTSLRNWKFTLGAQNLLDKDPPFTNQQTTFQSGYDPTYYDARARFVYGSVTYSFN